MGRAIAIANQKGGVGKTTTAINLSACLAAKRKKVLVIEMDPQGNTTSGFGVEKNELENTVYELILGECSVEECLIKNVVKNVSIIPSNVNLAAAEIELIGVRSRGLGDVYKRQGGIESADPYRKSGKRTSESDSGYRRYRIYHV